MGFLQLSFCMDTEIAVTGTRSVALNKVTGNTVLVNITQPGHTLHPGVVIRDTLPHPSGDPTRSIIANYGEGTGWVQSPFSTFQNLPEQAWRLERPPSE